MTTRSAASFCVLGLLLGLSGCQKLNDERTVTVDVGDVKAFDYDPPRWNQKLTVVLTPTGGAVDAYVVEVEDSQKTQDQLLAHKKPAKSIVGKEKISKEEVLETTIPAKTGFAIVIGNAGKKTEVKMKVTGR